MGKSIKEDYCIESLYGNICFMITCKRDEMLINFTQTKPKTYIVLSYVSLRAEILGLASF